MKRIFVFAVATAVALSSCSKNEIITSSLDGQTVGFSNYIGNSTKGSVVNAPSLNKVGQNMGVFAYMHTADVSSKTGAPNFMNNVEVKVASEVGKWTYSNIKYWPTSTEKIDFYAYAPYAEGQTTTVLDKYPVVSFTQASGLTDMVDYVYATADDQTSSSGASQDGSVEFSFKHALSRIAFSAQATDDYTANDNYTTGTGYTKTNGTYIYVKSIVAEVQTTGGVNSSFDLTFSDDNGSKATTTATTTYHTSGTKWEIFNYTGSNGGVELSKTPINFTTLKDSDGSTALLDATADDVATANKYIFLVPQTIVGGKTTTEVANNDIKVTVTYYTESYTAAGICAKSSDITKDVYLSETTFAQGKAYNFPISIGLNDISFGTVGVTGWGSEE